MTKNFHINEFQSRCGTPMPESVRQNIIELAVNLQVLRDEIKLPITIASGYRSPEHNARIKGAKNSQHIHGRAADIKVSGMTPVEVAKVIERLISEGKMLQGGIGIYRTWVHYDTRRTRARW